MRGSPTNSFLAHSLRATAKFLKSEGRPTSVKWLRLAARRLELLDCQVRNERARSDFIQALTETRENTTTNQTPMSEIPEAIKTEMRDALKAVCAKYPGHYPSVSLELSREIDGQSIKWRVWTGRSYFDGDTLAQAVESCDHTTEARREVADLESRLATAKAELAKLEAK